MGSPERDFVLDPQMPDVCCRLRHALDWGPSVVHGRQRLAMGAVRSLHGGDLLFDCLKGEFNSLKSNTSFKRGERKMSIRIATRQEWLTERLRLLEEEKELTRRSDEVARRRQNLPWVKIDKDYQFNTDSGPASLADLFRGRTQLLVYHFMFGPDYSAGCPSCSSIADGFNGIAVHLRNHDVMLWAVSRASLGKLQAFKQRMGWNFPWASSENCEFNSDFNVFFTEEQQRNGRVLYNYGKEPAMQESNQTELKRGGTIEAWKADGTGSPVELMAAMAGTDVPTYLRDRPGLSTFVMDGGNIYHAYSAYARGLDSLWAVYPWLDRAPKGRNETGIWWRHHDAYNDESISPM